MPKLTPIRILHVVLSLETGGLENGIVNLINFASDTVKIDVLCLRSCGELAERITNPNTQVFWSGKSVGILQAIKSVFDHCKAYEYDIVHSHGWATMVAAYFGAKPHGASIVNGEHGTLYFDSCLRIVMQKLLFRLVDINIAVSIALQNEIVERLSLPPNTFMAIANGVDTEHFKIDVLAAKKVRMDFGIPDDIFLMGTVGRLVDEKNYSFLIELFADMRKSIPQMMLIFIGDGAEREKLELQVREASVSDSVLFLGRRSDVANLMCAFDVFALTSSHEGMSNTLIEAMACGVPLLSSRVGGALEIIEEKVNGYTFESGDMSAAKAALLSLYTDGKMRQAMRNNCRAISCEKFSMAAMVKNYESVYSNLK